jgi:hypothetical protein
MTSHARLGAIIVALLACNTIYYLIAGRASEALDSVAWYTLLILFTLESSRVALDTRKLALVRGARIIAVAAVAAAAVGYVLEHEWLDATNIFLWIAVVVLLEAEVRRPSAIASRPMLFSVLAILLYSALTVLVVIWLTRGEWMDAWDAALWLAAFGVLELGLLHAADKRKIV